VSNSFSTDSFNRLDLLRLKAERESPRFTACQPVASNQTRVLAGPPS